MEAGEFERNNEVEEFITKMEELTEEIVEIDRSRDRRRVRPALLVISRPVILVYFQRG